VELLYGDIDIAETTALEALRLEQVISNRLAEAFTVTVLAGISLDRHDYQRAAVLLGVSDTLFAGLGHSPSAYGMFGTEWATRKAQGRAEMGEPAFQRGYVKGVNLSRETAMRFALGEAVPVPTTRQAAERDNPLTKRESQIAELVAEGMTNREIAAKLFISQRTAETHVEHILTKLGFNTRTQVVGWLANRN